MARLESQINVEGAQKAAQQEPRSYQQHTGQRDLRDYQHGAHALVPAALSGSVAGLFQSLLNVLARHPERRRKTEKNSACHRHQQRPRERRAIHAQPAQQGQRNGTLMGEMRHHHKSKTKPQRRAPHRKHRTLGEYLADQSSSPCAQRAAHGEFLAPRRRSRQREVRQIYANDEQNKSDRRPQHDERPPQFAADVVLQRLHLGLVRGAPLRMRRVEIEGRKQKVGLGLRPRYGLSRLQTADQQKHVAPVAHVVDRGN